MSDMALISLKLSLFTFQGTRTIECFSASVLSDGFQVDENFIIFRYLTNGQIELVERLRIAQWSPVQYLISRGRYSNAIKHIVV